MKKKDDFKKSRIQCWKIKYKDRVSSENRRCPRCKKIRKMWMRANVYGLTRIKSKYVSKEGKICWICIIREVDPLWRPGMKIPNLKVNNEYS